MSMDERDREKMAFCQHIAKLTQERDALRAELAKSRGLLVTTISIIRNNVSYTISPAWDSVRMAIKDIDEHLIKKGE